MSERLIELTPLGEPEPVEARPLFGDDAALLRVVIAVGAVFALWKLVIALTGNVIWEEGHFAVLGQRPDLAYPDIPAGWPLLARLCTTLFGWSAAAIRVPGLIIAETIPLAVYWLARGVVSHREALWAALIAIIVPALGMSGTIFYPEEALQIALAVMLGAIIRAMRAERTADALKFWALAGIAGGIGLFVHFRFVLAGVGVLLFLLAWPSGRRQWLKPGLWLAAALAALGLLPGLIYNLREHWPALAYQVANRPTYRFKPGWLLTFFENQLGLATPTFMIAFGGAARRAWTQVREQGDGAYALLLSVAGVIFGVYAIRQPGDAALAVPGLCGHGPAGPRRLDPLRRSGLKLRRSTAAHGLDRAVRAGFCGAGRHRRHAVRGGLGACGQGARRLSSLPFHSAGGLDADAGAGGPGPGLRPPAVSRCGAGRRLGRPHLRPPAGVSRRQGPVRLCAGRAL